MGAGHALPTVVELGDDEAYGPFLVLSLVSARAPALHEVAKSLDVSDVVAVARQVVDLVEQIAVAGFSWEPSGHDFHLERRERVTLSRVRCVMRLDSSSLIDVRSAFEVVGDLLLPLPAALGPTRLVRLLASRATGGARVLTPERARAELALVESELSVTPVETAPAMTDASDRGLCREGNEDATALATGAIAVGPSGALEPWTVMVVCDGVASSSSAALASLLAAKTTCDALAHFARSGDILYESLPSAMSAAIRAAHVALCATPWSRAEGRTAAKPRLSWQEPGEPETARTPVLSAREPPGTTVVAALVFRSTLVVGWVGDSRAYWLSPAAADLLTCDHSWASETVVRGELTEAQAMASPLAHTLTKCLGPLELSGEAIEEVAPGVCVRTLGTPGHVVLCTDGLWNYFPGALDLARVARAAGPGASTARIARAFVNHALARGGEDNVSVAVYAHGAREVPP